MTVPESTADVVGAARPETIASGSEFGGATQTSDDPQLGRIASAAAELDGIAEVAPSEAVARFDSLHTELQAALAELDES